MRILFVLGLMLAFPVIEAWLLFRLGDRFGGWVLVWLLIAALCGAFLIRFEKLVWAMRIARSLRQQRSPLTALLASARSLVAGLLLIFPCVISDVMALLVLIWPLPPATPLRPNDAERGADAIEGEYRRDTTERLPPRR